MRRGHLVAALGALALLFVMAMDWYTTATGEEARRIERITENPSGAEGGEVDRRLNEDAAIVAEGEEKNAWQVTGVIDRILLVLMLATVVLALVTAFARWRGARPTKGMGPTGLTAILATLSALIVAYRIIQEPGYDAATQVKLGAPLALLPLALIAIGMSSALRADEQAQADADGDTETATEEDEES